MAGSHDPKDRTASSLPRVVSAAAFAADDPPAAVSLAVECSRTTHQSPVVLDACRCYAGLLVGALRGEQPAELFSGIYEPVPGLWKKKPLKAEITSALASPLPEHPDPRHRGQPADVLHALAGARAAVAAACDAEDAIQRAIQAGREPALDAALAGTLGGAVWGAAALPAGRIAALARVDDIERLAARLVDRQRGLRVPERASH
jgi:ADP-ribosylglycohydrolase